MFFFVYQRRKTSTCVRDTIRPVNMYSQKRDNGKKKTKRPVPASNGSDAASASSAAAAGQQAEEGKAAKRAKTWADASTALERAPKMLTLTLVGGDGAKGDEKALGSDLSGTFSYRCSVPCQAAPKGRSRERGGRGRAAGGVGGTGRDEVVEVEWRVVRAGATEGDAAELARRSRPVTGLSSSDSSDFSSDISASSSSSWSSSSSAAAPGAIPFLGGELRLQLRHRMLRSERKEADGEERGSDEGFVPRPIAGSAEERRLMRARERMAKQEHGKKIREVEEAIENNRIEFERLTNDEDASADDIHSVASERQFLKAKLKLLRAGDAEVRFELRGEDVWYEVGLGCSVLLEELPGRPRVVWSLEGGRCGCLRSPWQSSHSVPYAGARMSGEVDVSRLEYERSIGRRGDGEGEFQSISGIATDEEHIYVADEVKNCIAVLDLRDGAHVRSWGSEGDGNMNLNAPTGVAVDDEHVYVADGRNDRVQVFTKSGAYVRSVGSGVAGEDGRLHGPVGISVDGEHIAVSGFIGDYISLFDKGSGRLMRRFGSRGNGQGQFNGPHGVALDGNHVYVVDSHNHRVQVMTKEGAFVRVIGSGRGSGPRQMQYPRGVVVDEEHVYVCDYDNYRIQIFSKEDGGHVREVRRDASNGAETVRPCYIVQQGDRLYVTNANNDRVAVFRGCWTP